MQLLSTIPLKKALLIEGKSDDVYDFFLESGNLKLFALRTETLPDAADRVTLGFVVSGGGVNDVNVLCVVVCRNCR